jgi:NADPH-dependent curcumin reductase
MMAELNRRIVLAARPHGEPKESDFRLETAPVPEPGAGELLLRTLWLSLDPYMRGRMNDAQSYARPVGIGEVMTAEAVSEIVRSDDPAFRSGDTVRAFTGWQTHALAKAKDLRRVDPSEAPVSTALGVLGMPGMTAYVGLLEIGRPKPGETVAVAAAAGPVGSLVGQIARLKGCRAVGIAGGPDKCRYLVEELGFDAAVDHRAPDLAERLRAACPNGIDVYFEKVGGAVWDAVLPLLNDFARVPVCGLVANYSLTELPPGPDRTATLMRTILTRRLMLRGFIVWDFASEEETFRREVGGWLRAGRIRHREDVVDGIERAPAAFIGLLKGKNFGKLLVRVAEPASR